MTQALPAGAPTTIGAAFAHINSVTAPTVNDLKMMVLLEAAGLALYEGLATGTENTAVAGLLRHNGREELAHAHRVAKAIQSISGEEFLPPSAEDNPYLADAMPKMPVTAASLKGLAQGECWASNIGNEEAARQFRLNGKEEADHGNRLLEAAGLLEG